MSEHVLFQNILKQEQPIVYQMLYNSLKRRKLSHAYLLSGQRGTHKKETAYLLAKSIICPHGEVFACETCDLCQRIERNSYADLIYVDGREKTVKSESVENIMDRFEKTGLEGYNRKVFIIDGMEHVTEEGQNKLLKFIEDPMSEAVTAILISEQPDRILPTIVSRCQSIPFRPLDTEAVYRYCLAEGCEQLDAYLLANIYRNISIVAQVKDKKEFQSAKTIFFDFLNELSVSKEAALLELETTLLVKKKKDRAVFKAFADMLTLFFNDLLKGKKSGDVWYDQKLEFFAKTNYNNYNSFLVCFNAQQKLMPNARNNIALVLEEMIYGL